MLIEGSYIVLESVKPLAHRIAVSFVEQAEASEFDFSC